MLARLRYSENRRQCGIIFAPTAHNHTSCSRGIITSSSADVSSPSICSAAPASGVSDPSVKLLNEWSWNCGVLALFCLNNLCMTSSSCAGGRDEELSCRDVVCLGNDTPWQWHAMASASAATVTIIPTASVACVAPLSRLPIPSQHHHDYRHRPPLLFVTSQAVIYACEYVCSGRTRDVALIHV